MGLEASTLSEELWTAFMQESFQMIICFGSSSNSREYLLLLSFHSILECSNTSSLHSSAPPVHFQLSHQCSGNSSNSLSNSSGSQL